MAPELLAQLFQPFNRLGKEAGAEEGTGIGLVVTKRLVELMGGSIGVDSVGRRRQRVLVRIESDDRAARWSAAHEAEHAALARAAG
jgi:signal transduction histidine kinase